MEDRSQTAELVRGWSGAGDLLSSVIAGLLIGLALDAWLGTRPLFVIVFIIVASIGGFLRLRSASAAKIDAQAAEAIRIRDGL